MNNYLKMNGVDIALLIVLYFISTFVSSSVYVGARFFSIDSYVLTPLVIVLSYIITFIAYYFIALKPRKETFKLSFSFKNFHLFPIILALFVGQYFITEFLTGLIPIKGSVLGKLYQSMTYGLMGNIDKHPMVTFLLVCIIAPIFEEIFFRGFILKGMLNNKVEPAKAILISALIFGGIHIFPWQVVGGITSGLVLGLAFYKTGSLLGCTLLHMLNNLVAFQLFTKYKSLETPNMGFNEEILLPVGIILILIFGYLYIKLTKNHTWKFY